MIGRIDPHVPVPLRNTLPIPGYFGVCPWSFSFRSTQLCDNQKIGKLEASTGSSLCARIGNFDEYQPARWCSESLADTRSVTKESTMDSKTPKINENPVNQDKTSSDGISRRDFVKCSAGTLAGIYFGSLSSANSGAGAGVAEYKIDSHVCTTLQRVISFRLPAHLPARIQAQGFI